MKSLSKTSKLKLVIPAQKELVSLVRLTIAGVVHYLTSDQETVEDIKTAVSEICSSIIVQAEGKNNQKIALEVLIDKEEMSVEVSCFAKGIKPAFLTPIVWPEPQERNLGLSIVTTLMDKVELETNKGEEIVLRLKKFLPE
jgi:anti-sigma regulatory factor (Ser/Thr protein kinase)